MVVHYLAKHGNIATDITKLGKRWVRGNRRQHTILSSCRLCLVHAVDLCANDRWLGYDRV